MPPEKEVKSEDAELFAMIEHVLRHADRTGQFAQLRRDQPHFVLSRLRLDWSEFRLERLEERHPCAGNATPNDYSLRVEDVHASGNRAGQRTDRLVSYLIAVGSLTHICLDHCMGGREPPPGALLNVPVADKVFDAAGNAGHIFRRVHIEAIMP